MSTSQGFSSPRGALPGRWRRFVRRYGWRAYAIPVLALLTVAALVRPAAAPAHPEARAKAGSQKQTQVEGLTRQTSRYQAAATPAPVAVQLSSDGVSCATNTNPTLVLVSISQQHLWACQGHKQVESTPVTTGKVVDNDQTPIGSWKVVGKERDRYLVGPGYRDYVHYWVPFNGDFGLHDAPWQKMAYGSPQWRTGGSHGCVHVPAKVMAWLYGWAQVGSTVVTVEH